MTVSQSFIRLYYIAVLNVAAGKAPMQISSDLGGIPQKAIDGSTSSFFNVDTCTLTRAERVPWWYVNLLEPYMVQLVRLDFGKSQETCLGRSHIAAAVIEPLGLSMLCCSRKRQSLLKASIYFSFCKYSMLRSGRLQLLLLYYIPFRFNVLITRTLVLSYKIVSYI